MCESVPFRNPGGVKARGQGLKGAGLPTGGKSRHSLGSKFGSAMESDGRREDGRLPVAVGHARAQI